MNKMIEQMLSKYNPINIVDEVNALKEIIQEIVLVGLYRGGFFDKAAFYGGTALRIFYGLDRFSEDLDFALISKDKDFKLDEYFKYIEDEVKSYGLNIKDISFTSSKDSLIYTYIFSYDKLLKDIKIKFEVDIKHPFGARYENKIKLTPSSHEVKLYDMPSLFAGKIHAVLCRSWSNRTKGRDLYDYVFFLSRGISVNMDLLKNKLIESGKITNEDKFDLEVLKEMLSSKFSEIDYDLAKEDVLPFIKDKKSLDIWSKDFFINITNNLETEIY